MADGTKSKCSFISEQLYLCQQKRPTYSPDLLAFAMIIYSYSAACYTALRDSGKFTLPSVKTLQMLSNKVMPNGENSIFQYLSRRYQRLPPLDHHVALIFDEIYISQRPEYSNGVLYNCNNQPRERMKTVLTFMIKSLASSYSDVIMAVPLAHYTVEILAEAFHKAITLATTVGYKVLVTICDNHVVNRSFFVDSLCNGYFTNPISHPLSSDHPLYLLVDPVHTIKNIYNNFLNRNIFELPMINEQMTPFTACFQHVRELYEREKSKPLKIAHKLNAVAMNPSSIQKTSMKHALAIFDETTVTGLRYYADHDNKPQWRMTASFVNAITLLWHIVNVKSLTIAQRKKDQSRRVLTATNTWSFEYLEKFEIFVDEWKALSNRETLSICC
jgi:hypothetical protein